MNKEAMANNADAIIPVEIPPEITENATIMDDGIPLEPAMNISENTNVVGEDIIILPRDGSDGTAAAAEDGLRGAPINLSENATIIDEGLKLCPLCLSQIKKFFINFNEKMLMCENTACEFPFGYEDLQFSKVDKNAGPDEEINLRRETPVDTPSASCSVVSGAAWTEIDNMNRAYESEDSQFEVKPYFSKKPKKVEPENDKELLKIVGDIKVLNNQLTTIDNTNPEQRIQNQKWLKNLMNKQSTSGVSLLKPEEMMTLKNEQPALGPGDLKIDIDTSDANGMPLVNVLIKTPDEYSKLFIDPSFPVISYLFFIASTLFRSDFIPCILNT
ncbi:uncharacterized protein LOC131853095 [Achroia grisella]|uniref:uncharacterized protein LOC131853095 n=1 Tax=Achroia grisella TaxID=688607 RepID=UPI0027D32B41|nr:uncharacterized protein LOC131853095 [Achroia grisella]